MSPGPNPSFQTHTAGARNLLVVDFGFLGDSVQLVPTLWELRRHHPSAHLSVLTTRVGAEVLRMAPCVDRLWDLELMPDRRSLTEQWRTLRNLRRERFDAAFNFSGSDRTVFWTWFSGARRRAASAWGSHHFWTRWLIHACVPQPDPEMPVARQRQWVLNQLGFETGELRYDLNPGREPRDWAAKQIPAGAIHLSVNAAKPLKEWPLEHSITLARRILEHAPDVRLVASGSSRIRERQRLQSLLEAVNHPRLTVLPEDLSIPQLTAALKRCRLHIGPDSGVMNLAAAVGVPTISFFRDQPGYKAWVPSGESHHVFVGSCGCVDHLNAPCRAGSRSECLAAITPATVFEAVRPSLSPPGNRAP